MESLLDKKRTMSLNTSWLCQYNINKKRVLANAGQIRTYKLWKSVAFNKISEVPFQMTTMFNGKMMHIINKQQTNVTFSRSSLCVTSSCSSFLCLLLSSLISSSSCLARPSWVAASSIAARYSCLLSEALCLSFSSDRLTCVCSVLRHVIWKVPWINWSSVPSLSWTK